MQESLSEVPDRQLSLNVGLLMDRSCNCSGLYGWDHFAKKVGGDYPHLPVTRSILERPANRQAVDGIDINSRQVRFFLQQLPRLAKAFLCVLMSLNHCHYAAPCGSLLETGGKAIGFLAVIDGLQHARDNRYLAPGWDKISHQLTGDQSV